MSAKFPSAEVLRRLGITDPDLFDMGGRSVQPTAQLFDFSRSIASEPIEARAYKDLVVPLVGGLYAAAILQMVAPGGGVVEAVALEDPLPSGYFGTNGVWFSILPSGTDPILFDVAPGLFTEPQLDIGGLATRSIIYGGYTAVDRYPQFNWEPFNNPVFAQSFRLFVPSGALLVFQSTFNGGPLQIAFVWRELAEQAVS